MAGVSYDPGGGGGNLGEVGAQGGGVSYSQAAHGTQRTKFIYCNLRRSEDSVKRRCRGP